MRFCLLASGSRGNALWIESCGEAVLIDAGVSCRQVNLRAAGAGLDIGRLRALVLSHEHGDHLSGARVLTRKHGLHVYATEGTARAWLDAGGEATSGLTHLRPGVTERIGVFRITPFSTSHDVADPVMFRVENGSGQSLGLATDLGIVTRLVEDRLSGCQALVLESNHDPEMLIEGPYPWPLKQRIGSRVGHLSNGQAAELLSRLCHPGLERVVLAHLSETNNRPELALAAARPVLPERVALSVAEQNRPTPVFQIGGDES